MTSVSSMRRTNLATISIVYACVAVAECPDATTVTPARLIESEEQKKIARNIAPEWRSDESAKVVRFGAYVAENGRLYEICCFSSSQEINESAIRMWINRLKELRFTPANRDGEDVRVYVGFSVISRKTDGGTDSTLLLNQLHSSEKFGARYSAPQRIATQHIYGERVWVSDTRITGAIVGEVATDVNIKGTPSNSRISRWDSGSSRYKKRVTEKMAEQCFTPGFVDGDAVAMLYSEVFQYQ